MTEYFDEPPMPVEPDDFAAFFGAGRSATPPPPRAARRPMVIEWFSDACEAALADADASLIESLLDQGAFSVFYGESNAGKSFVVLDMAHAVAAGMLWNGKVVAHGLIVYVAAEGGKRITRRLAALRKAYAEKRGHDAPAPLFALIRYPIDLRSGEADLRELLRLVREAEAESSAPAVWIIIDTLSRALAGGDENSSVDMGAVVNAADRIRAETNAHFTFVHHSGKDSARGARGHSLLRAATDTEVEITPGGVKVTKQRDMGGSQEYGFSLVDVELGVDVDGQPIHSAVVEWHDAPKAKKDKTGPLVPSRQRLLLETVAEAISECGQPIKPFADGPMVKAVPDEVVRERYYARVAEQPRSDDTRAKLAARQRQAFNLAIKANLDAKRLVAAIHEGRRMLWQP